VALFASFWINLFVVGCYSATFFDSRCAEAHKGPFARLPVGHQGFNLSSCEAVVDDGVCCGGIGLAQTEAALEGTLGSAAKYVWAVGLLAAGQASTMTGVFAGQFVMEGFLQLRIPAWQRLALTRSIALVPALLVALATQANPRVSDDVDQWLNILQAVQLPFALLPVLHFTSDRALMGEFKNGAKTSFAVWALALFVIFINIFTIVQYVTDPDSPTPYDIKFFIFVGLVGAVYLAFIGHVVTKMEPCLEDARELLRWLGCGRRETSRSVNAEPAAESNCGAGAALCDRLIFSGQRPPLQAGPDVLEEHSDGTQQQQQQQRQQRRQRAATAAAAAALADLVGGAAPATDYSQYYTATAAGMVKGAE
jgi:hypothetical protein